MSTVWLWKCLEEWEPQETWVTHHGKQDYLKLFFILPLSNTFHLIWAKDQELKYTETKTRCPKQKLRSDILEWHQHPCVLRIHVPDSVSSWDKCWLKADIWVKWQVKSSVYQLLFIYFYFWLGSRIFTNAWDSQSSEKQFVFVDYLELSPRGTLITAINFHNSVK